MTTPNRREALSCVSLSCQSPTHCAWALHDLAARATGSQGGRGGQAVAAEAEHTTGLRYQVTWQAATPAPGGGPRPAARQPLLSALLASDHLVSLARTGESGIASAAHLLQALRDAGSSSVRGAKQWLLQAPASGAVVSLARPPAAAAVATAAGLHGLLKVAAAEQMTASDAAVVYGALTTAAGESRQFGEAVHSAAVFSPILLPSSEPARVLHGRATLLAAAVEGPMLIAGGLGGLGLLAFSWSQQRQPLARVVLLGRSGRGTSPVAALPGSAGWVTALRADVATAEEAAAALALAAGQQAQHTVLHASGVLADALLTSQTPSKLRVAAAPKLSALQRLSAAAAARPQHQLLAFSSIAGELGTAGQGNYAAANAALDSCVATQRQQGQAGCSVQWGAWAGAGMAAAEPQLLAALHRQGYAAVQPRAGLAVLHDLLGGKSISSGAAAVMAAPFEWARFLSPERRRRLPFFAALVPLPAEPAGTTASAEHRVAAARQEIPSASRHVIVARRTSVPSAEDLQQQLAELVAAVSGAAPSSRHQPLAEAGLDSIGSVELRNSIVELYGVQAPATLAFDHPSIAALAVWLAGELAASSSSSGGGAATSGGHDVRPATPVATVNRPGQDSTFTAVASVSCRFPCSIEGVDGSGLAAFWQQAALGMDVQSAVPLCKWDAGEVWRTVGWLPSCRPAHTSTKCPHPVLHSLPHFHRPLKLRCALQP